MKQLSSNEERKWGWRTEAGAMGDRLACRKDRRKKWRWVLRLNHHPWRWSTAEVEPSGCGLEARQKTGVGNRSVEASGLGGGVQEGIGNRGGLGVGSSGEITLGCSCVGTLGWPGIGVQVGWQARGASRRHDLKMSQRLAMASI